MTFEDVLKLTRQRIGAIAVGLVIGIALSLVSLWLTPITYTASAVAYVRVSVPSDSEDESRADSYYAASQLASQKVKAFVPVFTSEPVAQGVINTLGLATTPAELSGSITATSEKNALTINVSAVAPTAAEAQAVADETVRQADAQIRRLEGSRSPVGLVLMSPSSMSGATRSPSLPKPLGLSRTSHPSSRSPFWPPFLVQRQSHGTSARRITTTGLRRRSANCVPICGTPI